MYRRKNITPVKSQPAVNVKNLLSSPLTANKHNEGTIWGVVKNACPRHAVCTTPLHGSATIQTRNTSDATLLQTKRCWLPSSAKRIKHRSSTRSQGKAELQYLAQCQCEPKGQPRQLKVECHNKSGSLSANKYSVCRSSWRPVADVKPAEPKYSNETPASEHWMSRDAYVCPQVG